MARIPYAELDRLGEAQRAALADFPPLNIVRILAHAEGLLLPYIEFGGAMLVDLELDPALRELAILRTATLVESEYEWVQHVTIGRSVGVRDEQIESLEAGGADEEAFDAREGAVLDFTTELVRDPRPSDPALAALREHLTDREVVELIFLVGSYIMLGRLLTALDVELDDNRGLGLEVAKNRSPAGKDE